MGCKGLTILPLGAVKKITQILQNLYKCRLAFSAITNPSSSLYFLFGCIKPFLDPVTIDKISIAKANVSTSLLSFFNPYQVEEKYGGKARNLEVYWPPAFPACSCALPDSQIMENSIIQESFDCINISPVTKINEPVQSDLAEDSYKIPVSALSVDLKPEFVKKTSKSTDFSDKQSKAEQKLEKTEEIGYESSKTEETSDKKSEETGKKKEKTEKIVKVERKKYSKKGRDDGLCGIDFNMHCQVF